jgi:hypothetical protein
MPHIHQVKNKPSKMRNDVPGSIRPLKIAVAVARAMPPSIKMA